MAQLSTRSLANIEASARRAARLLDGVAVPVTLGIDVQLGVHGAVRDATVGETGPAYKFWRLDAATIAEAMVDAAGTARSGLRFWRRV